MVFVSRPAARQGPDQLMGGHNNMHEDTYGNSSQDGTMMMREVTVRALDAALTHTHTHLSVHIAFSHTYTKDRNKC